MTSVPTHAVQAPVSGSATAPPSWKIKLLYDGGCPLCLREVRFLQQRDARRGLIAFVDVTDDDYRPEEHAGIDYAMAMGRIHAIKADGTILRNVEVFRQIYDLLGLGWIYAPTRWPLIGPLVDYLYTVWANWRLKLTGRPPLEVLLAQRQHRLQTGSEACCRLNEREGC